MPKNFDQSESWKIKFQTYVPFESTCSIELKNGLGLAIGYVVLEKFRVENRKFSKNDDFFLILDSKYSLFFQKLQNLMQTFIKCDHIKFLIRLRMTLFGEKLVLFLSVRLAQLFSAAFQRFKFGRNIDNGPLQGILAFGRRKIRRASDYLDAQVSR